MTTEEMILIEFDLFSALSAFHELEDRETRYTYTKKYFFKFCKENNLNPLEVFPLVQQYFNEKTVKKNIDFSDTIRVIKNTINNKKNKQTIMDELEER